MSKVRSERLKRDLRNASRSRLHTRANGRGCSSQFYRFGFANPVETGGMTRRQWPGTRVHLYRLVLSASWVSNLNNGSTEPPKVFRLEIRSGRFLMRQRRCLGSPHPDFASVADSLSPSLEARVIPRGGRQAHPKHLRQMSLSEDKSKKLKRFSRMPVFMLTDTPALLRQRRS